MTTRTPVITIDGPSGAGKGTISRLLAHDFGYHFLDSGALYRIVAVAALQRQMDIRQSEALAVLAAHIDVQFELGDPLNPPRVIFEGEDVTDALKGEVIGNMASQIAASPAIREALLERQRSFRELPGLVADGRDMGTVVFPDADVKIFLTASPAERARRRYKQLQDSGLDVNLSDLLEEISARDERDQNRPISPLVPAKDAIIIDTTDIDATHTLARVKEVVAEKLL